MRPPVSLIIICTILIVLSLLGLGLTGLGLWVGVQRPGVFNATPELVMREFGYLGLAYIVNIALGILMLLGKSWARLLFTLLLVGSFLADLFVLKFLLISWIWASVVIVVLLILFSFLYSDDANDYFA